MCDIRVGDDVVENQDYRKSLSHPKRIHGTVTNIDEKKVATVRLFCGCTEIINTHWLSYIGRHHCGCCCNHQIYLQHSHCRH